MHKAFEPFSDKVNIESDARSCIITPKQLRWKASPIPDDPTNFIHGLQTMCCAGSPSMKDGYAVHVYAITADMHNCCLCNADGDFLIVPQHGAISGHLIHWLPSSASPDALLHSTNCHQVAS